MCRKASRDTLTGIAPKVEKPQDVLHAMAGYLYISLCRTPMEVLFLEPFFFQSRKWYPDLGLDFRLTVQLVDHSLSVNRSKS